MVFTLFVVDLAWLLRSEPPDSPDTFENAEDIAKCCS